MLDFDAAANSVLPYALSLSGDISPAQITANQNDYNPAGLSTASVLRMSSDASRNVTSLAGGVDGRIVTLMNIGSNSIILKNDDGATGTAANRFALAGDLALTPNQAVILTYDSTASRWRAASNGTATSTFSCPSGFTKLQSQGQTLGCMKDSVVAASGLNCRDAATSCWNSYGGRLPTYNEYKAAQASIGGFTIHANLEWVGSPSWNSADNESCGGIEPTAGGIPSSYPYTRTDHAYRCFIPAGSNGGPGSSANAAGSDTQVQFNDGGTALGGDGGLIYNKATDTLTTGALTVNSALGVTGATGVAGTLALSGDISPAQITANQNNYNPAGLSTASVLRVNSNASRNITSLAGGADGRVVTVMNIGSFPIVLKNDDGATGTAANRFALTGDLALAAKQSAMLMYDSTALRWRQIANGTATGSGDNLGNHTATQNIVLGSNYLSGDGGNEGIAVDASGKIGIGITPATALLTVNGDAVVNTSLTAFGGMLGSNGSVGTPGYRFYFDPDTGLYSPGDNANVLGFVTGGTERARIDANGNVGIGTSPVSGTRISVADSGGGVSEIATLINSSPASAGTGVGIVYQGPSSIKLGSVGAMWEDGTGNNSGLYFNTRNTSYSSKMYLSAAGDLGIGTIGVPKERLHIYSTDPAETGLTIATPGTGDQQAVLNLLTKSNGSDTLGDATSAGWQIWANGDGSTAFGAIGGPNTFGIGFVDGAGWDPAAFQILPNGRIGIGTHANGELPGTTLDVGGSFALSGDISPAQIAADQNDYDPAEYDIKTSVLRLTSDASHSITGIVDGADGRVLTLLNVGSNPIVLSNQNASSAAANRFAIGADFTIGADQSVSLIYDDTSQRWRSASLPFESSGLVGPSGCATIGDLCADGTVFAGYHPITQEHLFIPTTDQGTTSQWKTSTGTNDIATDSTYDGRANTNQVANSTTFPAFKLCKDLTTGGHSDWYLPSRVELYYLWSVQGTIEAAGNITNLQNASYYWSSTEYDTNSAWPQYFPNGTQGYANKLTAFRVRCVRR
ncbi:DUF1566 domain-containing protein [Nitrobacter hamburgensis]|uniref:Lcl C-terminal domain-containing protein n=1 Tax=Nitrobacter hamburgensis TaxID=912 RepID=UPI0018DD86F1|nr:DUF1566 domain-containing protein [Nitrobacter hamburgensis]